MTWTPRSRRRGPPDGAKLAFTTAEYDINVVDANGANPSVLAPHPAGEADPVWAPLRPAGSIEEPVGITTSLNRNAEPVEDRIVFVSTRDGHGQIFSMNPDGTDPRRLTNGPAKDSEPSWSPDRRHVAFSREIDGISEISEIYLMEADGTNPRQVTHHDSWSSGPVWSPDGRQIAYYTSHNDDWEIFVVSVDDGSSRNLTQNPGTDTYPHWSPDGRSIVFHSKRDGDWEISVMEADGSNQRRLTRNAGNDWLPAWSPDGRRIAFWSTRDGYWELYLMQPDGKEPQKITSEAGRVKDWISRAAWSPDGLSLAIVTQPEPGNFEIVVIDTTGNLQRRLTQVAGDDVDPAWSR